MTASAGARRVRYPYLFMALAAALAAAPLACSSKDGGGATIAVARRHLIRPLLERGVVRNGEPLPEPVPILHDLAIGLGFMNDVEKMSLTGRPGGWARIERLELPAAARLEFDVALQRPGWTLHRGGVTVTVEASVPPGAPAREVVSRHLDPARVATDRAWVRVEADLTALGPAGALADLTFRIDGAAAGGGEAAAGVPTVAIGWPMLVGTEPLAGLEGERARPRRRANSPNVLVLLVDALRADRLSCYGHARPTSPAIDALAEESVRYATAIAPASWTTPSVASLMTGLAPRAHGVVTRERSRLPDACETLAESYAEAGYATAAFVTNPIVDRRANFDQGFETFELLPHFKADAAIGVFLEWLDARPDAPFFAYLHLMDTHAPYSAPPPFLGRFDPDYAGPLTPEFWDEMRLSWQATRELGADEKRRFAAEKMATFKRESEHVSREYDAEVAYADDAVGRLVARLRSSGLLENTVLVFTADHGEAFFEHGFHGHGKDLHEETIRIPLLVRKPGPSGAGRGAVVDAPVSLVDVGPTLAKLTAVRPSPLSEGRSIWPEDATEPDRIVFSTIETGRTREADGEVTMDAARALRRKAIEIEGTPSPFLFDLEGDPKELRPLAPTPLPAGFGALLRDLAEWRERTGKATPDTTVPMDDVQYAILKGLGYVK